MIDRNKLNYRQGVVAYVRNNEGKYLIFQHPEWEADHWRVPGGGLKDGEDFESAINRELREEFGLDNLSIKAVSSLVNQYEWPDDLIQSNIDKGRMAYRGQQQKQVLILVDNNINIEIDPEEVRDYKWILPDEFDHYFTFTKEQSEQAKEVVNDFVNNGY